MSELAQRAWFRVSLALGQLLRASRYSKVRVVDRDRTRHVQKTRAFYAPLLVWFGNPLMKLLNTGVRVLSQHEWEERESKLYLTLYHESVQIARPSFGLSTLLLPFLPGVTLASLLDNSELDENIRTKSVALAAIALREFHAKGFTHGDAMAENVLIDVDSGAARWFDFETIHDASRAQVWRRADDVRALVSTVLLRTIREKQAETLRLVLDAYADRTVQRSLTQSFTSAFPRALVLHLGQAGLSFERFRDIGRLLSALGDER